MANTTKELARSGNDATIAASIQGWQLDQAKLNWIYYASLSVCQLWEAIESRCRLRKRGSIQGSLAARSVVVAALSWSEKMLLIPNQPPICPPSLGLNLVDHVTRKNACKCLGFFSKRRRRSEMKIRKAETTIAVRRIT